MPERLGCLLLLLRGELLGEWLWSPLGNLRVLLDLPLHWRL